MSLFVSRETAVVVKRSSCCQNQHQHTPPGTVSVSDTAGDPLGRWACRTGPQRRKKRRLLSREAYAVRTSTSTRRQVTVSVTDKAGEPLGRWAGRLLSAAVDPTFEQP
eukprot:14792520-Heterocapsa_arctica.AAC.1